MAKTLGTLFVEFRATADKFTADLKNMAKEAKEFDKTIKPIRETALSIGTGLSVVGGAVTAAFVGMAKQAANFGDQIRDMSIRTGISTQVLSGLKLAAEQTGTSVEGISTSLQRMSRSALAAAQGSNAQANAFKSIGVSVKDASGQLRPMDALLGDVAERFKLMKDGTEKAALAQQLLGRSGVQMIEFLNQGKDGLKAMEEQAAKFGLTVSQDAANAADEFNDSLNMLKNAQLGLSQTIGQVLLPALTKGVNVITNLVVKFRDFAAAHPEITRAVFLLAGALTGAGGLLVGFAGLLAILPALTTAFTLLTGPIGLTVAAFVALGAAMVAFPKFRAIVSDTLKNVIGLFALLGSQIGSIGQALMQLATGQFKTAWNTITTAGTRSLDAMTSALDGYDSAVKSASSVTNIFSQSAIKSGDALKDMGLDLDAVTGSADKTRDKIAELSNFLRGAENNLAAPISRLNAAFDLLDTTVEKITPKLKAMSGPVIDGMEQIEFALKTNIGFTAEQAKREAELAAARKRDAEAYARDLQRATDDIKRSAGKVFDDMFIKGENVFKSLKNLLKGGALSLGRAIFEDIAGMLLGPLKKAFDDFFKGLLETTVGAFTKSLGEKLGNALLEIPGTGGGSVKGLPLPINTPEIAPPGSPPIPGVGGGAGGGAGGASGALGWIGLGLQVAQLGVSAFAGRGRAQRTEENTRETRDWLELAVKAWNPLFHEIRWFSERIMENTAGGPRIADSMTFLETWLIPNMEAIGARTIAAIEALGPQRPTISADVQAVTGGASAVGGVVNNFNFTTTVEAGATMTEADFREKVIPAWVKAFQTGARGMREEIARGVRDDMDGLVTA